MMRVKLLFPSTPLPSDTLKQHLTITNLIITHYDTLLAKGWDLSWRVYRRVTILKTPRIPSGTFGPVSPSMLLLVLTKSTLNSKQVASHSFTRSLGSTGAPGEFKEVPLLGSLPRVSQESHTETLLALSQRVRRQYCGWGP